MLPQSLETADCVDRAPAKKSCGSEFWTRRFMELTFLHMMLAGEAFGGIIRNGLGKPEEYWLLLPPDMKEVMGEDGSLVGWVQRTNGKQILWDPDDVRHFQGHPRTHRGR
jgi:hypothetical protein